MGTLITPWHEAHDIRCNRSQLVPVEFKSGPSYVKHTIVIMPDKNGNSVAIIAVGQSRIFRASF